MGKKLNKDSFTPQDHDVFRAKLYEQLDALEPIIHADGFSKGQASFGAELELYVIDEQHLPCAKSMPILDAMQHPLLTEELNQFNLEINLSPVMAEGMPFTNMQNELASILKPLKKTASDLNCKMATIGILPTLNSSHLHHSYITDMPRYQALTKELSALKGEPFLVDINGQDSLKMHCDEVTLEGANTSFQVHLKVPANKFARLYNAAQITTPLVLAIAANSPTFLGQRLWQETRIALFKQSIDNRVRKLTKWRQPARVSFGHGWVRHSAFELFKENVALYRPLIPYVFEGGDEFSELCLHHGTVWSWNRAVFEPGKNKHLRIEYRYLPAGPTNIDMMANAAFAIGLTQSLAHEIDDLITKLPFEYAEYNFYRAAKSGLATNILWPMKHQHSLREHAVSDVISSLIPKAADGLAELNVNRDEISTLLGVIEKRLSTRQTGANWQIKRLTHYCTKYNKEKAINCMLNDYLQNSEIGEPVATW